MDNIILVDWDGTLRDGYTSYDWLIFLEKNNTIPAKTSNAFKRLILSYKNKEIEYEDLVEQTATITANAIKGINATLITEATKDFVLQDNKVFDFVDELCDLIKDNNLKVVIISGAPEIVLNAFRIKFPFDYIKSLKFTTDKEGIFTGEYDINYGLLEQKKNAVEEIKQNISKNILFSIGDSLSDKPLFKSSQHAYMMKGHDTTHSIGKALLTTPNDIISLINTTIWNKGN